MNDFDYPVWLTENFTVDEFSRVCKALAELYTSFVITAIRRRLNLPQYEIAFRNWMQSMQVSMTVNHLSPQAVNAVVAMCVTAAGRDLGLQIARNIFYQINTEGV